MTIEDRFDQLKVFLTESGRVELVGAIKAYRSQYGEAWLAEFKAQNLHLAEIVDLIVNHDLTPAVEALLQKAGEWIEGEPEMWKRIALRGSIKIFIDSAMPDLEKLHTAIRAEIDRPRISL